MSEDIKRKISVEMDSGSDDGLEFSEEVKSEIETNEEIKKYTDDLMKLESLMDDVRDNTESDPDEQSITNSIMESLKKADEDEKKEDLDELLSEPCPETNEDRDDAPKDDLVEKAQKEDREEVEGRAPAFTFPAVSGVETGEELKDVLKMEKKTTAKPGAAKGDSSGIINMSALVEEHRKSMAPPPAEAEKERKAAAPGGVEEKSSGMKYVLAIAAVLIAVVGIVVIMKISKGTKKGAPAVGETAAMHEEALKQQITAELMAQMEKEKASAPAVSTAALVKEAPKEEGEAATKAEESEGEEGEETVLAMKKKGKRKGKSDLMVDDPYASEPKEAKSGGSGPKTKKEASKDTLMDLLDTATKEKGKAKEPEKPAKGAVEKKSSPTVDELMGTPKKEEVKKVEPSAGLPATLNKNQIKAVMRKLNPKIQKCGEGKVGNLILMLVVNSDGTVKSVKSSGQFASDPTGKCAEQVAMKAKFPPFTNASANVTYPYVFAPPPGQ